jgi:hypothetical protein
MNALLTLNTAGATQRVSAPTASLPSDQVDLLGSAMSAKNGFFAFAVAVFAFFL